MRHTLIKLGAVLTVLAGLYGSDRIGLTVLAPGTQTGFGMQVDSAPPGQRLLLSLSDTRSLLASVRLLVRADTVGPDDYTARLTNGAPLTVDAAKVSPAEWQLLIWRGTSPGVRAREKFQWPNDHAIELTARTGSVIVPHDWSVRIEDGAEDNASRTKRREVVRKVQLLLFALFVLAGFWAIKPDKSPDLTAERLVTSLIESVTYIDPTTGRVHKKKTRQMQTILRRLRAGDSAAGALSSAGLNPTGLIDKGVFFAARKAIRDQVAASVAYLNRFDTSIPPA